MIYVNSYDFDGVIFMGEEHEGLRPGPKDVIVTGRSYTQEDDTRAILMARGLHNMVFFNPLQRSNPKYGREESGRHKARVFNFLESVGIRVVHHFEDDQVQADEIRKECPRVKVVMVIHPEIRP